MLKIFSLGKKLINKSPPEKIITPSLDSTIINGGNEWRPTSFENFLIELKHITPEDQACIFRGHCKTDWLLDSTLARSLKKEYQKIKVTERYQPDKLRDTEFQHHLTKIWLQKVDSIEYTPELLRLVDQGADPYFEFL